MRLSRFLDDRKIPDSDFAVRIGVSRQAIYRYKNSERLPDQPTMEKIFKETDGLVAPNDFYGVGGKPDAPDSEHSSAEAAE